MGYCTVADVCSMFPQFDREATGSVPDADIQSWIDNRKARIRSVLLARGFDPDNPPVTGDSLAFLKALNMDGAVADLGDVLMSTQNVTASDFTLPGARRRSYERVIQEIIDGVHDPLFQPSLAKVASVRSIASGIGGAETDPVSRPPLGTYGNNRFFSRNQRF